MPSRTRRLPLALSLAFHGLALAALCQFAPRTKPSAPQAEPLAVRFVAHASIPREEPVEVVAFHDRKTLPPEPSSPQLLPQTENAAELFAELPAETFSFATEVPASARRSLIGASLYGSARLPHAAAAPATAACATPGAVEPCAVAPAEGVSAPVPLDCPAPEYPAGAASVHECGKVRLSISLGEDGRVESLRILQSSGYARLDEAAVRAVERWRFRPACRAGAATRWTFEHAIVFREAVARG